MNKKTKMSHSEFVVLVALLMSLTALSIDTMLPALSLIGRELHVIHPNDAQLIISTIFLGISVGMVLYGPLSDSFGRKPSLYLGLGIFVLGCVVSLSAQSLTTMLVGRFLQGFGAASPRVVTMALVRDKFSGAQMAQVMSFSMTLFVLVPALAPLLGQGILAFFNWHAIFVVFILVAGIILLWFGLRMEETLVLEKRRAFQIGVILSGAKEAITNSVVLRYIIILSAIQGSFIGFLSSAQQVFSDIYSLVESFPFYFAMMALSLGFASFINAKIVVKYGANNIAKTALMIKILLALLFLPLVYFSSGKPDLIFAMGYFMLSFFSIGMLFGNLNALAMQPLGHIAGVGAAVVGSLSTLGAVPIGILIGRMYNETLFPLVLGFLVVSSFSLLLISKISKAQKHQ